MAPKTPPHPVLTRYYRRPDERHPFVMNLFDGAARYYDAVCSLGSLGTGRRYRLHALRRAGLARGMKLLDVATGTGLVARSAVTLLGEAQAVVGLDPSAGMLAQARKTLAIALVQGKAEELPFAAGRFDVLSIGYALRHVADLDQTFGECWRVLKPGGRLLILEMTRPQSRVGGWAIRGYLQTVLPLAMRAGTGSAPAALLTRYFWDTIDACVPPETVMDALQRARFVDVRRHVVWRFMSEYVATKPSR